MGSRSTKVAAPLHVKAVALPVAPAQQQHQKSKDTNESAPLQDSSFQSPAKTVILLRSHDDINLECSTHTNTPSKRRYSEPARTTAMAVELDMNVLRHLEAFETFIAERNLLAINIEDEAFVRPVTFPSVEDDAGKVTEPEVQCLACCTQLPKEGDARYSTEVIKPCRSCNSAYCILCVKNMFLKACKDFTLMPPRCCTQLHLHHVKPYLTAEEIAKYRSKYEEWSTPKPFYCPVPTCSAFISKQVIPQPNEVNKRKVDSGIGIPTPSSFECPQCESSICIDCRQVAHTGSLCADLELGVDVETAALLKSWGYKRCPKCSQGLKRMYGCNHMECRCGAHFCWGCMQSRDDCEGGCNEDDDEDEDYGSDSEHNEDEVPMRSDGIATNEPSTTNTGEADAAETQSATQEAGLDTLNESSASRSQLRPRNLDGGPAHYWEEQDLDFGEEPTDDIQDRSWDCHHSFIDHTISLTEAISISATALEMECVRCWGSIQPVIDTPPHVESTSGTFKASRTTFGRARGGRRGRGRGLVARLRPTPYIPPRGLVRSDAVVGTATHLTARLPHMRPRPSQTSDRMEGVQPGLDASSKATTSASALNTTPTKPTSNVFGSQPPPHLDARECYSCSLLVCSNCASSIEARQNADAAAKYGTEEAKLEDDNA